MFGVRGSNDHTQRTQKVARRGSVIRRSYLRRLRQGMSGHKPKRAARQRGRGGIQANCRRVELGPRLWINRRDLSLPRIPYGLAELANVVALIAKMNRQLRPAYHGGAGLIDPWQPVGQPSIKIKRSRRIANLPDCALVQRHGMFPQVVEKSFSQQDFA
jgi:hypothetical protein